MTAVFSWTNLREVGYRGRYKRVVTKSKLSSIQVMKLEKGEHKRFVIQHQSKKGQSKIMKEYVVEEKDKNYLYYKYMLSSFPVRVRHILI